MTMRETRWEAFMMTDKADMTGFPFGAVGEQDNLYNNPNRGESALSSRGIGRTFLKMLA